MDEDEDLRPETRGNLAGRGGRRCALGGLCRKAQSASRAMRFSDHYGLKGVAIADPLSGFGGEAALARRAKYSLVNGVIRIVFVSLMPAVRTKGALVRMGSF